MKHPRAIGFLLLFAFVQPMVQAQEKEPELDPVTVTTSLTPQKLSHTGRNLVVVKGDRFENLPVHSLDELLRFLPGVEIQARGPLGSQSDIVLRGGTFQQVLVILDGMRLNDPNTGHFSAYIPIAPAEIDRIEILKGASSAIYGSEAVGGVIHIITKTFAAKKGQKTSRASAQVTGGEYDLLSASAGGFFSNGQTSVSAGLLSNNTSGQPQRGTRGSVYSHTGSFSLSHYITDNWSVKMRFAYDDRRFSAQNFYTNFTSDTADERITGFWNQLAIVRQGKKDRLSLNIGYKSLDDKYRFNSRSVPNKSNSKLLQGLLTDELSIKGSTSLTTGLQFIRKQIESNDRGEHSIDQVAAFASLNTQLGDAFFFSPAARLEWNERSGWELIPQLNLSYRKNKLQLRASGGKTIRDADFTERFNNYQKSFVASGRIGNPDLEAERSFSYEAGADYFVNSKFKASAGFFQRYHSRLIDYVPTPYAEMPRQENLTPSGNYALARNISKVTTTGMEADLQYVNRLGNGHQLWATLGLLWLDSESSETTPSFYISSHARFLTNFSLQYTTKRLALSTTGLYKTRAPQTSSAAIAQVDRAYFVLNARVEAFVWQQKLSVFAQADNLFDKSYADLLGAQMPGRWLMGGIKISLSK
ncbi:MAG TPA: TonB-dependent receptor [Flavisolibacter sp.]|nr:TonB-dependent receptor [Flavisolibacter sp.]